MGSACATSSCDAGESSEAQGASSRCGCGSSTCGGDPVECATGMWTCAFFTAMKQVQVDLLKAKIHKAWGAKMDKAADAVVEAMGAQWQSMLAQAQAKAGLRERLQNLWQEGRKS